MFATIFKFYTNTENTWEAMLEACKEAEVSIDIEQYIFADDEIGSRFCQLFLDKAKSGVKIRMLLDGAGSYSLYNTSRVKELSQAGIQIKFFNTISPWRIHNISSWFFRNHKKVLVIDKKVGFTGGTGIGYHMRAWRDTTARVEGEVVLEMESSFEEMWAIAEQKDILLKFRGFRKNAKKHNFITNSPYFKKRFLYYTLMEALRSAKKSICITTPYFIPDRRLIRILRQAVRRGVDVKVIVPERINILLVATASHSSFSELLRDGVQIFKYQPYLLHAKTIVVDDNWATYGSFNLDSLSFLYNYEANIVTVDPSCIGELTEHFETDLQESKQVIYKEWKHRPFLVKVQEFFVRPIRGFV